MGVFTFASDEFFAKQISIVNHLPD
jgi:hypothetical protein